MRIGTRASALALAQAELVAALLGGGEIVPVVTSGDRGEASEDKSRWVSELEVALAGGQIDLAVHSAKDVPGELAGGLALAGAPPRVGAEDVLCGARSIEALAPGARVEALAKAVMSRLLHEPTIRLRSLSEDRGHASLELVRELFGLRDEQTSRPGAVATPPPAGSYDAGSPGGGSAGADRPSDDLAEVRQLRRPPAR